MCIIRQYHNTISECVCVFQLLFFRKNAENTSPIRLRDRQKRQNRCKKRFTFGADLRHRGRFFRNFMAKNAALPALQISQEADQVVWYSHLFQNFPQFIVIHTVKGFGIVNKAEIDVFFFWNSLAFSMIQQMLVI